MFIVAPQPVFDPLKLIAGLGITGVGAWKDDDGHLNNAHQLLS